VPESSLELRYGMNPHQRASIRAAHGTLPLKVLNGKPSAINLMDAVNSWQLVRDLRTVSGLPAAASFKHVSPSGAALGQPLSQALRQAYAVDDLELTPLAEAYARARGTDPLCSYGDCVALSDPLDVSTALLLKREVSDVLVAPGHDPEALAIVCRKKGGNYLVLEVDPAYVPPPAEERDLFGLVLVQDRNTYLPDLDDLGTIITASQSLPDDARRDIALSLLVLKYTQSNSIGLAWQGQTLGVGAGQQSRIHCARIAADKADRWYLRQHPKVLSLRFHPGVRRPDRNNYLDAVVSGNADDLLARESDRVLASEPVRLSPEERADWLRTMQGVTLGSDGLIPFRDTIDRAHQSGVQYVAQTGGALRNEDVISAADAHGMVMVSTGTRLFHH
jgi:phosphoribosylaminoimidazolecarboxamide formyltransferase/IMP cyclohydrolase